MSTDCEDFFIVKLWSTNMEHSVSCLEAKANVCCVKFNPESRYHLSFGSAGMLYEMVARQPSDLVITLLLLLLQLLLLMLVLLLLLLCFCCYYHYYYY